MEVILAGDRVQPEVRVRSRVHERVGSRTLVSWAKAHGGRWRPEQKWWVLTALGAQPSRVLASAGVEEYDIAEEFDAAGIDEVATPLVGILEDNPRMAAVYPRLRGFEACRDLLPLTAHWDKVGQRFLVPLDDVIDGDGTPRSESLSVSERVCDEAVALHEELAAAPLPDPESEEAAEARFFAAQIDDSELTDDDLGRIPGWFGLDLFGFQKSGALAVADGHTLLADAPGLGKCVERSTKVQVNGGHHAIGDLWDAQAHRAYADPDGGGGELIDLADGEMLVESVEGTTGEVRTAQASHLYRQRYRGPIHRVETTHGERAILCTPRHRLLVRHGSHTDLEWVRADAIAPEQELVTPHGAKSGPHPCPPTRVRRNTVEEFDGYVYDLTVPGDHSYMANGLWSHNTRASLAAVSVIGAQRTLFVVPPVVLTNWAREISASGLIEHSGDGAELVVVSAKRKEPAMPPTGAVVISDSLVKARPQLFEAILEWRPTALIYDEAHRAKTPTTAVAQRMRELAGFIDGPRIALTGTPVLNSTAELAPILSITGHLDHIFGGYDEYMHTFCRQNRFGAWQTKKRASSQLKELLDDHVWVRRTKAEVLPDLPQKMRTADFVDIDLTQYRKAHKEVIAAVTEWLRAEHPLQPPTETQILAYAQDSIGLSSPMRRAAGLAKATVAGEIVAEWVAANPPSEDTYDRPLLLWAHHTDVVASAADAARAAGAPTAVIDGSTPAERRQEITDAFQAGEVAVLVCSIAAASVGITLTRGADMIFLEQDWTPALNSQAEDRMARIGQTRPVSIRTLLAAETLDEHVYATLNAKADMLDGILTGGDNRVTVDAGEAGELATSTQIVARLVADVVDGAYTKSGRLRG
jgi:hypothetical protein